jgi:hypothetical protein
MLNPSGRYMMMDNHVDVTANLPVERAEGNIDAVLEGFLPGPRYGLLRQLRERLRSSGWLTLAESRHRCKGRSAYLVVVEDASPLRM